MIVKELASAFQIEKDHIFSIYVQLMLIQSLWKRQQKDVEARAVLEELLSYGNGAGARAFEFYFKEEAFIRAHARLEDFFRKGDPSLSSFVKKPEGVNLKERTIRMIPAFIAEWNASSRRVFQLGNETQRLFEETQYDELEKDDLIIPFPNFIVRLSEGIPYEGHTVTAIGFSEGRVVDESLSLPHQAWGYVLLRECTLWQPLTEREKAKFLKDSLKSKKCAENMRRISHRMERIWDEESYAPLIEVPASEKLNHLEMDYVSSMPEFKSYKRIHSIIVNLMAVLSQMSRKGGENHPIKNCDKGDVSSTENVFDISSVSSLGEVIDSGSSPEGQSFLDGKRKVTPHWRRKHARRRPGMGHIPDAPKDVIIPATLVLADFLKAGQLPVGGTIKI